MTNRGEAFLHHLKANPTLLDPAPVDQALWGDAMAHRRDDEVHACLRCGNRAQLALIAETPDRLRFLDLCFECRSWLEDQMHEAWWRAW